MAPGNFEILNVLKCVQLPTEAPFCMCMQYIHTCQLPSSFIAFRSKSTMYGAEASDCKEVTKDKVCINLKFASAV